MLQAQKATVMGITERVVVVITMTDGGSASVTWNGFDTIIPVAKYLTSVMVVASDQAGREIGRSDITSVSP